jgi:hypothetical protein
VGLFWKVLYLNKSNWLAKVQGSPHRYFSLHTRNGRIIKEGSYVMEKKKNNRFVKVLGNKVCPRNPKRGS